MSDVTSLFEWLCLWFYLPNILRWNGQFWQSCKQQWTFACKDDPPHGCIIQQCVLNCPWHNTIPITLARGKPRFHSCSILRHFKRIAITQFHLWMHNHSLWCSKDMQWFLQLSMLTVLQITTNKFGDSADSKDRFVLKYFAHVQCLFIKRSELSGEIVFCF